MPCGERTMNRSGGANSAHKQRCRAATANDFRHAETDYGCLSSFQSDFFFPRYMCELESSALIMALLHTLLLSVIGYTGTLKKKSKNKINQLLQLRDESVILNTFAVSHPPNLFPQHVR